MNFLKFLSYDSNKKYVNTLEIAFVNFFYLFKKPKFLLRLFNLHSFLFIEHEIVEDLLNIIFKLKNSDGFQGGKSFTMCSIFCKHRDIL